MWPAFAFLLLCAHSDIFTRIINLPITGTPPSPRYGATFIPMGTHESAEHVYFTYGLVGGIDENKNFCDDLYSFSTVEGWEITPTNSLQKSPKRIKFCWAHLESKHQIIVWGGYGPEGFSDDLFLFDISTSTWTKEEQSSHRPSARYDAAFSASEGYLYIFGGRTCNGPMNDLWRMNLTTHVWEEFPSSEGCPAPRTGAQMCNYQNYVLILGGKLANDNTDVTGTVWRGSISVTGEISHHQLGWTQLPLKSSNDHEAPSTFTPRFDIQPFVESDFILLIGGTSVVAGKETKLSSFCNFIVGDNCECLYVNEFPLSGDIVNAPALSALTLTSISEQYITFASFGGITDDTIIGNTYLITFNINEMDSSGYTPDIKLLSEAIPHIPSPRSGHSAIVSYGHMFVFGGLQLLEHSSQNQDTSQSYTADLYSFDLFSVSSWERQGVEESVRPPPRAHAAVCEYAGQMFVFGGIGIANGETVFLDDLWIRHIADGYWTEVTITKLDSSGIVIKPNPRMDAAIVVLHNVVFVVGGILEDGTIATDVWKLNLITNAWDICPVNEYLEAQHTNTHLNATHSVHHISPSRHHRHFTNYKIHLTPRTHPVILVKEHGINDKTCLIITGGTTKSGMPVDSYDILILPPANELTDTIVFLEGITNRPYTLPELKHAFYSDSTSVVTEHGIIFFYGTHSDLVQKQISYIDFTDILSPTVTFQTPTDCTPIIGGTAVLYGSLVYLFGGQIQTEAKNYGTTLINAIVSFYLNPESFGCSPGTYVHTSTDPQIPSFNGCARTPDHHYTSSFNESTPTPCSAGSYSAFKGGYSEFSCVPTPRNTFSATPGSSFTACTEDQYCPPGSITNNATRSTIDISQTQPPLMPTNDEYTLQITIVCYVIGAVLGLLIGTIACLCPTRKKLFFIDLFTDKHYNPIPSTHLVYKFRRESRFGGFMALVYVFFVLGAVAAIVIQFVINNVTEQKSLISYVMDEDYSYQVVKTDSFTLDLYLLDYTGECIAEGESKDTFTACSPSLALAASGILSDSGGTPPFECKETDSSHTFFQKTKNCQIRVAISQAALLFNDESSVVEFSLICLDPSAYAYLLGTSLETDTGIFEFTDKARLSRQGRLIDAPNMAMFRGSNATVFTYSIVGSVFTNQNEQRGTGIQVINLISSVADHSDYYNFYTEHGLRITIRISQGANLIRTAWSRRQEFTTLLSSILATVANFLGVFGIIMLVVEIVIQKVPCREHITKRVNSEDRESLETMIEMTNSVSGGSKPHDYEVALIEEGETPTERKKNKKKTASS